MITQIKHSLKGDTYTAQPLDQVVEAIRSGVYAREVDAYRREKTLREAMNDLPLIPIKPHAIPRLCFAAQWRKKGGGVEMQHYNSLVMLKVSNLSTTEDALRIRQEASRIPYTRLAFVGITGRDVVIVCQITIDGAEALTPETVAPLHLAGYKKLHYLYSSQLMLSLDNDPARLDSTCTSSADPDIYYNPQSEPLFVDADAAEVPQYRIPGHIPEPQFLDNGAVSLHTVFEWCLTNAYEKARIHAAQNDITDEKAIAGHALNILAENCNDAAIPLDFAVRHASWKKAFGGDHDYIERLFTNAYEQKESKMIPYGHVNKNALMAYKIEAFLKMHYELRRNVMTGVVQYRNLDGYDYDFHDLTDEALNTMTNRAVKAGIGSWDKDVKRIINSNDIRTYAPIEEYIFSLPKWDGKDRIADIARRLPTDTPNVDRYLRTWLLSMVAHWLGRDTSHGNALVPLLIGHQGCGKTTFCGIILPPELRDYYNDQVNFKNETDLNLGLTSFALINIDEFDSVKKSQQPVLKYLLSKSEVKMRPPYGKAYVSRRRFASFIATTNNSHPLVDRTGSRRFACIHITEGESIDTLTPIDYDQLYAQLHHEIFSGARYWLNEEETAELMAQNRCYRKMTDLSEMVEAVFTPTQNESEGQYMTTYEIIDILAEIYPELSRSNNLNAEIGRVLKGKGYQFKKRNTGVVYLVGR